MWGYGSDPVFALVAEDLFLSLPKKYCWFFSLPFSQLQYVFIYALRVSVCYLFLNSLGFLLCEEDRSKASWQCLMPFLQGWLLCSPAPKEASPQSPALPLSSLMVRPMEKSLLASINSPVSIAPKGPIPPANPRTALSN